MQSPNPSNSLQVFVVKEIDDLEMGVLSNGTPFLTGRSLARLCGIAASTMNEWGELTPKEGDRLRAGKMATLLSAQGFEGDRFFLKVTTDDQLVVNAYPDAVCMSFLEYYAFEAGERCTEEAKTNYRALARKTLQEFIYRMTGYDPLNVVPISWQQYHDRLILNSVPIGYFSVFKETADIVITSIREGLIVDQHTVPDISVGTAWSKYWAALNFDEKYGNRTKYPHVYPDYFPQSQANGSINAFIYPGDALGEFRKWIYSEYLPNKFPNYLKGQVRKGAIPASRVELLLGAFDAPILESN
jgi:hypothetical protein